MNNIITVELCAEDRARLDRLAAALEGKACDKCVASALTWSEQQRGQEAPAQETTKAEAPAESTTEATGATEAAAPPVTQPEEETATAAEDAPVEATEPTVTLEQIQQKVVQLAAGFNGSKKAAVREIINTYAKKVADLPEDKWAEVWGKLTALESEG
jgi:hypothetical protein